MDTKRQYVIFGNGLMGSELVRQTGWDMVSRATHGIEITDSSTYRKYLKKYDTVINCTGYTKTWHPIKQPAWHINYVAVMDLVDLCNKYKVKLVHISTDYIYANSVVNATEDDVPVHFDNWYTYTKLLSDAYIQARCDNYLMIRASYKPRPFPWEGAYRLMEGNFDYVDVIAEILIGLIEKNAWGVYNVGTEPKTMLDLARQSSPDVKPMDSEPLPRNIIMDVSRMKRTLR